LFGPASARKPQKGDYAAAQKSHEQLLQIAQAANDQSLLALAHSERGLGLGYEQKFTEALDHLDQAGAIYSAQEVQRSLCYNLKDRSDVLWRLGRYDEAQSLLTQAEAIANKPGGVLKRLSAELDLVRAKIAFSQGRFPDARAAAAKALEKAGSEFEKLSIPAKMLIGRAQCYGGAPAVGRSFVSEAFNKSGELGDPSELADAQLALSEAMLFSGESQGAAANALKAAEVYSRLGQAESEWRSLTLAAQATQNLGDKTRAREYAVRARDSLSKLEQQWGSDNYKSYLGRPDIQQLRKQLDQLNGPV